MISVFIFGFPTFVNALEMAKVIKPLTKGYWIWLLDLGEASPSRWAIGYKSKEIGENQHQSGKVTISTISAICIFTLLNLSHQTHQIMLRVCSLLLPILLVAGAPLSGAEDEDQDVRKLTCQFLPIYQSVPRALFDVHAFFDCST